MADQYKRRRWLPAFSVRTLLIVTTLLCAYAACWWPTKTQGVKDVWSLVDESRTIRVDDVSIKIWSVDTLRVSPCLPLFVSATQVKTHTYYFWFFGYVVKLPYEREVPSLGKIQNPIPVSPFY